MNYSFVDSLRNPPDDADVPKIDLVACIEALDSREMNSMLKFYTAVHKIVDSTKDAHLQFLAPFDNVAMQYFPYDLSRDAMGPPTLVLWELRGDTNLSEESNRKLGFEMIGAKVCNMSLNSESNPTKTPLDVLLDWAEEKVASAEKKTNRFNRSLLDDFAIRKALEPQTADFIVIVTLANGEQKTVPVPFGAYVATEEPIADLGLFCPKRKMSVESTDPAPNLPFEDILRKIEGIVRKILSQAGKLVSSTNHSIPPQQSNSDNSTPITTSEFSITSAVIPTEKIDSVNIGSFSENALGTGITFVQSPKGIMAKKCEILVLDLRGNTEGSLSLTIQLMELLWPNRIPHCPA
ncbi:hypothetical protein BLNAU_19324 [Blattamonas nauphoetae]|uniref:Tail specific protease domain-containing protein n=1 Tax=Blattamonas nauphoetae TaxID=2049346 RepID=A0ABQ9X2E7_9EUKA|nr:hypothetical protein BLNAU_19324 [Blattamonas nauphoetae]